MTADDDWEVAARKAVREGTERHEPDWEGLTRLLASGPFLGTAADDALIKQCRGGGSGLDDHGMPLERRAPVDTTAAGPLDVSAAVAFSGLSRSTLYRLLALHPAPISGGGAERDDPRWPDAAAFMAWHDLTKAKKVKRTRVEAKTSDNDNRKATRRPALDAVAQPRAGVVDFGALGRELTGKRRDLAGRGRGKR